MNYLSICSGIEAASVAWHPLGWQPLAFSEIEPFPSAVLAHHWPDVPNLGDMTKHHEWPTTLRPDLIVGGTPCQAFSVAGLRQGLADPRGNLTLTFLSILERYRPRWVVWENVPGVLSDKTGAFGAFLGGLGQLGYGFAYRVLDAQYFGVAQRRRRVFVVGCLGDWRRAAAVLFESHSLQGNPAPSRQKRKGIAGGFEKRAGDSGEPFFLDWAAFNQGENAQYEPAIRQDGVSDALVARGPHAVARMVAFGEYVDDGTASTLKQRDYKDATDLVAHTLRGSGFDASEDGTGRGTPIVPAIAFERRDYKNATDLVAHCIAENIIGRQDHNGGNGKGFQEELAYTLNTDAAPAVAFSLDSSPCADRGQNVVAYGVNESPDIAHCLRSGASKADKHESTTYIAAPIGLDEELNAKIDGFGTLKARMEGGGFEGSVMQTNLQVRRLTPTECERLQGFPDGHTAIPYRGKPAADGPRYKALGNSMAVPVMRWIGERIHLIDNMPTP